MRLILASASPRRHELLRSIGVEFEIVAADIDETERSQETARSYVERVARAKADAIRDRLGRPAGTVIVAADTTVDLDGVILAKPDDDDHARTMLRSLSGRTHHVHTAVAGWADGRSSEVVVTTAVEFAELDDDDIDWYLSMGEHRDKAGAYGMQGAAGVFVSSITGSPSNVIGLPLLETIELLRACGFSITDG